MLVACYRQAMTSDVNPPSQRHPHSPSLPPANERIAVVVNGNAKNVTRDVVETLDQILLGGDLFVSRRLEEGPQIARTIAERGYGTVLTGGGDGTFTVMVTEVVRACRKLDKKPPRFGLLKLGTGNSLAWVVGASKAKGRGLAADILRLRQEAGSRSMRLIEADDFLSPFCGFGIDAVVLHHKELTKEWMLNLPVVGKYVTGEMIYAMSTFTRTFPFYMIHAMPHCRIINEGADAFHVGYNGSFIGAPIPKGSVIFEGKVKLASCSTIPYYGFGFRIFPYAEEREDRMALRVSTVPVPTFIRNFPAIWRGEYHNPKVIEDFLVEDVTIEIDPATPFQIGGDSHGTRSRVRMRLSPEPIELVDFYAPPRG
jgi:diacylglycerol kinase family enzyme